MNKLLPEIKFKINNNTYIKFIFLLVRIKLFFAELTLFNQLISLIEITWLPKNANVIELETYLELIFLPNPVVE